MIIDVNKVDNLYIASEFVDFRKSIDGLVKIVSLKLKQDPASNSMFIFCNKNRDKIKIICWDGSGWWLLMKRIERGKFSWPTSTNTSFTIDKMQLNWLIQGLKTEQFFTNKTQEKEYASW